MQSAFGIEHGYPIAKAAPAKNTYGKPSAGRVVTGTLFGGAHGAVAGRKGKKLAAAGSSFGHAVGGGAVGGLAAGALGAVAFRGEGAPVARMAAQRVGSNIGTYAGSTRAVYTNQAKGRYKPER